MCMQKNIHAYNQSKYSSVLSDVIKILHSQAETKCSLELLNVVDAYRKSSMKLTSIC
jgi:hypothetical protein